MTLVRGKAARLPIFYYGRSLTPSQSYAHWHPLDFLLSSPDALYRDYARYRKVLHTYFTSRGYDKYSETDLAAIIDLIHFRYLTEYVRPSVLHFMIGQMMAGTPKKTIMQDMWTVLARENDQSLTGLLGGSWLVRRVRDRFFPKIRSHHIKRYATPTEHRKVHAKTIGGVEREYLLYKDFLASVTNHPELEHEVDAIIAALNCYE